MGQGLDPPNTLGFQSHLFATPPAIIFSLSNHVRLLSALRILEWLRAVTV